VKERKKKHNKTKKKIKERERYIINIFLNLWDVVGDQNDCQMLDEETRMSESHVIYYL
jgi:hypothetical protein